MFEKFKIRKGEKLIMVENGKPTHVILSYEDYEEMLSRKPEPAAASLGGAMAGNPSAVFADDARVPAKKPETEFSARLVMDTPNLPEDISGIRLEDLPL